jgi:uncharacterized protein YdeI (YjbR/CyaY-like superfamily)
MPKPDKRVDAYIAKAPEFAKPILTRIREIVHEGCPECEETLKWSAPTFMYAGAIMCGMVTFKEHCAFHFWKGSLFMREKKEDNGRGQFGRITSVSDLPSKKVLIGYIKQAMAVNESGVKVERGPSAKPKLTMPKAFADALKKNKKASAVFDAFSASAKYEYVEWIAGAKTDATRDKRIEQAVEWIAEGKKRNWKYQR